VRTLPSGSVREQAVFFGGDYELLAAVPARRVTAAIRAVQRVGGTVREVGVVRRGSGAVVRRGGDTSPMPSGGWDPFRWALTHVEPSQRRVRLK
jgi:thiamine monophosphate kinase